MNETPLWKRIKPPHTPNTTGCPNCKSTNLSNDWTGLIILLDVENSEIAKKINAKSSGKYAIRVR